MINEIQQESFKFYKKKITRYAPFILLVLMIISAMVLGVSGGKWAVMATYASTYIISFILIITGSTIFSMEFENIAIRTLLYKAPNKLYVYLSKFFVIVFYDFFLHILAMLYTFIIASTGVSGSINWGNIYQYNQSLLLNMINTTLVDFLGSLLLVSIIFLTSCLINNNALVIVTNLALIAFGQDISDALLNSVSSLFNIIKWNPFNMMHLMLQYANYDVYHELTKLSISQVAIGSISYTVLFMTVGYLIFSQKHY